MKTFLGIFSVLGVVSWGNVISEKKEATGFLKASKQARFLGFFEEPKKEITQWSRMRLLTHQ